MHEDVNIPHDSHWIRTLRHSEKPGLAYDNSTTKNGDKLHAALIASPPRLALHFNLAPECRPLFAL